MKIHSRVTAFHYVDNLGTGLYESVGQRILELLRNSLRASMPDPKKWEPKRAKIEIFLTQNHPLANRSVALTHLDHGCGLTDPNFDRYYNWLGTPLEKLRADSNGDCIGDSQKGIGRFAPLAMNENCLHENRMVRVKHGFYLLTRTSKTGKVRFIPYIPENVELEGVEIDRWVEPTATEMGPLSGIQGSFTAIVVPTPIFKNHSEIYEAVKWLLPREQDKMFELLIGGKIAVPPPLEKDINVTSQDGRYRARLGVGNSESDGVWLCDDITGFRVASGQKLGRLLPDPLWFPDLVGDIFAPGLLRYQNTARSTLAKEFTNKRNKEWQKLMMFLISQVAPAAKQLIERDAIRGNAAETLDELAEMFNDRFGPPDDGGVDGPPDGPPIPPKPKPDGTKTAEPKPDGGGTGGGGTKPDREKYRRYLSIKVREKTYYLYRGQSLHPCIFAQVNPTNRKMIQVNVRGGYKALPETKQARKEHCLMEILDAIGESEHQGEPRKAREFARQVRSEFLRKT